MFQVALVDKAGRRTLTLVGLGGMCCCAIAMTVGLKLQVCPVRLQSFSLSASSWNGSTFWEIRFFTFLLRED